MGKKIRRYCSSRKVKYATLEYAIEREKILTRRIKGKSFSHYRCMECGAFHLTTMTKGKHNAILQMKRQNMIETEAEFWEKRLVKR